MPQLGFSQVTDSPPVGEPNQGTYFLDILYMAYTQGRNHSSKNGLEITPSGGGIKCQGKGGTCVSGARGEYLRAFTVSLLCVKFLRFVKYEQ